MQITSAMKMVSAAKLKRAQDAIIQMRPYANKLKEILEQLGLAASSATDELNNVSTKNLPDGLKVASAEFQATNASYGSTYQTIYQVENNYSKDFSEMVANAQNQSRFNQTGNARRGY